MMKKNRMIAAFAVIGLLVSCESENLQTIEDDSSRVAIPTPEARVINLPGADKTDLTTFTSSKGDTYGTAIYMAEYITADGAEEMGNVVFFNDRGNKQLGADFVPALQQFFNGTTDISYYVDLNRPATGLAAATTGLAITNAMDTWEGLKCSEFGLNQIPSDGRPTGWVAAFLGFPGSFAYVADVVHNGWMPASFFDILAPGGSNFILGVTFTIIYTDAGGNPIDVDNNGKIDVAFREIYYNDNFPWNIGSTFDVETVALHEAGHGLSQAHFGTAFLSNGNGKVHFAPRAVMNASYSGVQTNITKTDNAGHCSNWAEWPNN